MSFASPRTLPLRTLRFVALALVSLLAFGGGSADAGSGTMLFTNQTVPAGVTATHAPSYGDGFLAGGAVGDFNGDGFQDIYFPAGGLAVDRLFINNGDGTFTDEAAAWGIAISHGGTAAAVADFNRDGWVDLYVSSTSGNKLYRNEAGTGFTDVAASAGVATSTSRYGAAWGDYDLDGDLDLAVVEWSPSSNGNRLFRNNGDETFTDVTVAAGVSSALGSIYGFTTRFADMDGDRYPELLWVGDFGTSRYLKNEGDGTFSNSTVFSGVGYDSTEMGHTVADLDRNGLFDWYVTTINTNNLYRNLGNHQYQQMGDFTGTAFTGWGWATVAVDFDHDGDIDIAATSQDQGQFLLRNYTTVFPAGSMNFGFTSVGFNSPVSGRGLANFDYDNDGDQDLVLFPRSGGMQLFRNDLSGADTHWLKVSLDPGITADIPPHGVGSVISVTAGGFTQIGRIDAGNNYLSQSELVAHFGVADALVAETVTIEWSNGAVTTLTDVPTDQHLTVVHANFDGFLRGDVNGDGGVDIADPVNLLAGIFSGGAAPTCDDAADANDDGTINLADAVSVLAAIFDGNAIPSPAGACDLDPTPDSLDCAQYVGCP